MAARPSSAIARPSGVGLPPPCRTRSSSLARTVPVDSEPRTRRMSSQCARISLGCRGVDALQGDEVQDGAPEPIQPRDLQGVAVAR